jgi:iron complex outermembrane receptor protein
MTLVEIHGRRVAPRSAPLRLGLLAATAVATLTAGGGQALAQSAEPPAGAATNAATTLGEVVVTAQKRVERLQDVPLSVAVVSAETLEAFRFNETTDIQYLVPGVQLTNAAGPRSFGFFVRGVGTSSFSSESIEGSTAFVLDGVVLGQSGASLTDLPDVERIEVLRGPQGTLFGKNASAGVINVTTSRPSDQFHAKLSSSWAWPDDERKVSGLVTGPITDDLRFLVSARLNKRDGYIDNVYDGRKLNDRNDYGFRGKLEWTPTANLDVTTIGDYWKRNSACCIWTLYSVGPTPSLAPERQSLAAGIVPSPTNEKQNIGGDVFSDARSYGLSTQADYRFGDGYTLTSITAWRRWFSHDGVDSDSSPLNLLDINFADFKQRQWTQELRLTSPQGRFIDYVAGLFYFDGEVGSTSTQRYPTVPAPFYNKVVRNEASTRNIAIFGQANVNFSDKFRLILGGRALEETATATKRRFDPRFLISDSAAASKRSDALVWRTGVQYDFTHDIMAFATATKGYKGGGYDTNIGLGTLPSVAPEKPLNYEVGLRTSWPAQRLIFNVTAFHTDVKGYQVSARDPITTVYYIQNSQIRTKGVEFDLTSRPLAAVDWTLTASGSYIDAKWGDFRNAPCGQSVTPSCPAAQQDLTGKAVPFSPKWTLNLATHYERPIVTALNLTADLGVSYRSKMGMAFPNDPATVQDSLTLVNGAIGVAAADGRWKLSVFGKNLTDKVYNQVMFATPFGAGPGNYSQFIPYEARRIVGVSLDLAY